ncbi:MAG: reverse transcriptase domain-containing protein, partial [Gemmatimonadota bacterium]
MSTTVVRTCQWNDPIKREVIDCVGGVISPLLANIYIHRLLKAWKKFGLEKRLGARIVNYADDLVVVCRTKAGAREAHTWLE